MTLGIMQPYFMPYIGYWLLITFSFWKTFALGIIL